MLGNSWMFCMWRGILRIISRSVTVSSGKKNCLSICPHRFNSAEYCCLKIFFTIFDLQFSLYPPPSPQKITAANIPSLKIEGGYFPPNLTILTDQALSAAFVWFFTIFHNNSTTKKLKPWEKNHAMAAVINCKEFKFPLIRWYWNLQKQIKYLGNCGNSTTTYSG